ncbi:MAG: FHA domain-containing protein [Gemmatimonadaceae bacterium]
MAIIFGIVVPKRRRAREKARTQIDLVPFGSPNVVLPPRPAFTRPAALAETAPYQRAVEQNGSAPAPAPVPYVPARPEAQIAIVPPPPVRAEYPPLRLEVGGSMERASYAAPDFRTPTVRIQPMPGIDGTLQFLPGRLEIIEGSDSGQEVRFVRTPGPDGTSVTFGRSEGPAYRHVTLNAATVSRLHARMVLDGKGWRLVNLSRTNPIVVNGRPIEGEGTQTVLNDGDRVEMGEVVFRYHSH